MEAIRQWRDARIVRRHPVPGELWNRVRTEVLPIASLDPDEQDRLLRLTTLFLYRKRFHGAHGLEVTDHMRVVVAAQACLLILNLGQRYFHGWQNVVLYQSGFVAHHQFEDEDGIRHDLTEALDGEASLHGPVALSWEEICPACATADDGAFNLVLHEFAHKLDYLSGDANGCPPLHRTIDPARWKAEFLAAYQWLCDRVDADLETPIDPYAAENPAEFFAVATESFFLEPARLQAGLPEIYALLRAFYRQDPLARLARNTPGNL